MRDNGFARAQAAYEARTPEDCGWYADEPMTCPECDGDTDNVGEDCDGETVSAVALPCDECVAKRGEGCW